jgi:hypothetical protein
MIMNYGIRVTKGVWTASCSLTQLVRGNCIAGKLIAQGVVQDKLAGKPSVLESGLNGHWALGVVAYRPVCICQYCLSEP